MPTQACAEWPGFWQLLLRFAVLLLCGGAALRVPAAEPNPDPRLRLDSGLVEGLQLPKGPLRSFRGIPYAAAPTGSLRWRPPQPVPPWDGVRKSTEFGARCTQAIPIDGVSFRDPGESEDCLFLNVWTPARSAGEHLPVFVWVHGGAMLAGAASEPRYDGEALARRGLVVVTLNYRLGVFGFLAHPELSRESGTGTSGNYGFMDQLAALQWVARNIAAFGGDPANVTLAGESAGSLSVCLLMASPLAQGLFHRAIGESGAMFSDGAPGSTLQSLSDAEAAGQKFGRAAGLASLADLRGASTQTLLKAVKDQGFASGAIVDGRVLPASVDQVFAAGRQLPVPLLAGWNADEGSMLTIKARDKLGATGFKLLATLRFGFHTGDFLRLYPAGTDAEAFRSATWLAGDDWTAYATWKWLNLHAQTAKVPVYRYYFEQPPLTRPGEEFLGAPAADFGVYHTAELEYVFHTLEWRKVPVPAPDSRLADTMGAYWANFVRGGDPNGSGLPAWPVYSAGSDYAVMHFAAGSAHVAPEDNRPRYLFLEARGPSLK